MSQDASHPDNRPPLLRDDSLIGAPTRTRPPQAPRVGLPQYLPDGSYVKANMRFSDGHYKFRPHYDDLSARLPSPVAGSRRWCGGKLLTAGDGSGTSYVPMAAACESPRAAESALPPSHQRRQNVAQQHRRYVPGHVAPDVLDEPAAYEIAQKQQRYDQRIAKPRGGAGLFQEGDVMAHPVWTARRPPPSHLHGPNFEISGASCTSTRHAAPPAATGAPRRGDDTHSNAESDPPSHASITESITSHADSFSSGISMAHFQGPAGSQSTATRRGFRAGGEPVSLFCAFTYIATLESCIYLRFTVFLSLKLSA